MLKTINKKFTTQKNYLDGILSKYFYPETEASPLFSWAY